MQSVLPEHSCLLVSPGNYWQNQRELFDSDPDLLRTIQKHEPKGLHTSATLRGNDDEDPTTCVASVVVSSYITLLRSLYVTTAGCSCCTMTQKVKLQHFKLRQDFLVQNIFNIYCL